MITQNTLLIGNLAIATVLIKIIISTIKQFYVPKAKETIIFAMVLGILVSFGVRAEIFTLPDPTTIEVIIQRILSGIFIGASSVGIHEVSKQLVKKGSSNG